MCARVLGVYFTLVSACKCQRFSIDFRVFAIRRESENDIQYKNKQEILKLINTIFEVESIVNSMVFIT